MPNWKKVVVSGSDATLNSISSSLGIYSAGNITAPNFIGTASRATSASIADSIKITNDANNRIITSNGNNTLNAEETLTYDGSQLSFDAATRISINSYRLFDVSKNTNDITIALGDLSNAFNSTELRVNDGEQKIELFFSSSKGSSVISHYFDNTGLFVTGAITASELYIDNRTLSPAFFSGDVDVTGRLTAGTGDFNELSGNWLSSNGANRVVTSDGDGTFTAEVGLTYTPNTLNVSGSVIATGDITAYGNLIAKQFIVSSSVSYFTESFSSGSTKFGDSSDDTHQFTGSLLVTGSITGTTLLISGNKITDSTIINSPVIKFANLPENLNGEMEGVVVWDSTQGQLYWTSSLGSGFTTAHTLQQVTTAGSSTTIPITASIISASNTITSNTLKANNSLELKGVLLTTSSHELISLSENYSTQTGVFRLTKSLPITGNTIILDLFKFPTSSLLKFDILYKITPDTNTYPNYTPVTYASSNCYIYSPKAESDEAAGSNTNYIFVGTLPSQGNTTTANFISLLDLESTAGGILSYPVQFVTLHRWYFDTGSDPSNYKLSFVINVTNNDYYKGAFIDFTFPYTLVNNA